MDLSKKYPNMVADADPFSIGPAEVEFDRFFSQKVNRVEVEAYFHPRLNAVSLEFKFELLKYRQFWDGPARKQFAAALELYRKDFDEKKLIDKYRRTRAVYGKVKARVEWEAFKYAKTRVSNPMIELGYRFKEKTPFFATFMRSAKEIVTEEDTSSAMDSQYIYMYFTRAQADQMAMLFDQDRLMELLKEKTSEIFDKSAEEDKDAYDTPKDDYYEYGEK
jgi:hypothetical protein